MRAEGNISPTIYSGPWCGGTVVVQSLTWRHPLSVLLLRGVSPGEAGFQFPFTPTELAPPLSSCWSWGSSPGEAAQLESRGPDLWELFYFTCSLAAWRPEPGAEHLTSVFCTFPGASGCCWSWSWSPWSLHNIGHYFLSWPQSCFCKKKPALFPLNTEKIRHIAFPCHKWQSSAVILALM